MEDELKPIAMYIITHYIWNAVRKNIKKRLLVVDEAWWMMKSEDTASFLFSMAKRRDWMIPTPFVLTDAIIIKEKIKASAKIAEENPLRLRRSLTNRDSLNVAKDTIH